MTNHKQFPLVKTLCSISVLAALVGCGGGSTQDQDGGGVSSLRLKGTAAVGAPIASAPVAIKCATGTGSASTAVDGSFEVSVSGGKLPCVLRVTSPDGSTLYSVASGDGSEARANVSPLTDLAVSYLAGSAPAELWNNFDPDQVTNESMNSAVTIVLDMVKAVGINGDSIGDPFTAVLVPPNGPSPGNSYDQALETLQQALEDAGLTLDDLRTKVIASNSDVINPLPTLPPELLLAPKADHCRSLASGRYRVLGSGGANRPFYAQASVDARNLSVRLEFDDGSTGRTLNLRPRDSDLCEFDLEGELLEALPFAHHVVVGASGIGLVSFRDGDGMALVVPEQSFELKDLQGEWVSFVTVMPEDAPTPAPETAQAEPAATTTVTESSNLLVGRRGEISINANGSLAYRISCSNFKDCGPREETADLTSVNFSQRPDGWFSASVDSVAVSRFVAMRSGGGRLHLIGIGANGGWEFLTRKRELRLPEVGYVSRGWYQGIRSFGGTYAGDAYFHRSIVLSTSPSSNPPRYIRESVIDTSLATVDEALEINAPSHGYLRRAPLSDAIASDGRTINTSEFIGLPLVGIGLVPIWFPVSGSFTLSLNR